MSNVYYDEHKESIDNLIKSRSEIRDLVIDYNSRIEQWNINVRSVVLQEVIDFCDTLKPHTDTYDFVQCVIQRMREWLLADFYTIAITNFTLILWSKDKLKKWFSIQYFISTDRNNPYLISLTMHKLDKELEYVDQPTLLIENGICNDEELVKHSLINVNALRDLKTKQYQYKEFLDDHIYSKKNNYNEKI